jgi:hypothetical protein
MNSPRASKIAALAVVLGIAGCGAGTSHAPTASTVSSAGADPPAHIVRGIGGFLKSDGDNDADEHRRGVSNDDELELVRASRSGATAAERREVTTAIKHYFAAAAARDATTACAMLLSSLAAAVAAQSMLKSAPSCSAVLARQLSRQHEHLAAEQVASMIVTGVHVSGATAYATLGFRNAIESEVVLQRQGGSWKMNSLFDSSLP